MDLALLLRRSEGKTLEYKRDLSSTEPFLKTIVAFANTAGGTVVIGIDDKTKHVRGVPGVLGAEERVANLIADGIQPQLIPDIEIIPWRKLNVLAVQAYPSNTRPHHLVRLGPETGVFIRVGSTNRRADSVQIEELRRLNRMESFDELPLEELKSEALDFRVASELFSSVQRNINAEEFRTLRMTSQHRGRIVPTIGGLLLFGKNRLERFPDAWVQAGRFAGLDRSRLIDSAEIRSYLPQAAEEAVLFVHKHLQKEAVIGAVRRHQRWSVPPVAIREVVINAIVHADYAQRGSPIRIAIFNDRIEVDNPGLLPYGLTVEDIRRGVSKLRNRVIGRVFHELRLIEQWGSGIQRMITACNEAGLPTPVLEELGTHFRVVIRTIRTQKAKPASKDRTILEQLAKAESLSTAETAALVGLSSRATFTRLRSLVERGLVVEIGTGPHDPRRRYALAESN
jgi:predicted HTH transcriptional regulator